MKLYVELQQPVIELTITARDSTKQKSKIIVGFKRFEAKESTKLLNKMQELLKEIAAELSDPNIDKIDTEELDNFIKEKILYIRQASLVTIQEDGSKSTLTIQDTRKAKPLEDFWETSEDCLIALLDMYLASSPWRSSFNIALQKALVNNDFEEDELKNS